MKTILAVTLAIICIVVECWALPPLPRTPYLDTNCNQSKYFMLGSLCQDTDDAKLYKGTGAAVVEITSGAASGDMTKAEYDVADNGKIDADKVDNLAASIITSGTFDSARIPDLSATYTTKALYDAYTLLMATSDNTPITLTVTEQTVVGRATGGAIAALAIDSDLTAVSGSDDTIPSAKATKAYADTYYQPLDADLTAISGLTVAQGAIMVGSAVPAWSVLSKGTQYYPLVAGASTVSYAQLTGDGVAANTITAAHLSATLTFASTDSVDLSAITATASQDYGLAIPTWADVVPTSDKRWLTYDATSNVLKVYEGGWVSIGGGGGGAPTDAKYWTSTADATLTQEVNIGALTTGLVKITVAAGVATPTTAASGTDYAPATSGTSILKGDGSGGFSNATFADVAAGSNTTAALGIGTGGSLNYSGSGTINASSMAGSTWAAPAAIGSGTPAAGSFTALSASTTTTLNTSWTGILKATSGVVAVATAGTDYPGLASSNTFTANNSFGDADTDTFSVRSLIVGGNSRAVWIAGTAPTPTYATGTNELYVAGDIESAGTVYAAGFYGGTGTDGQRAITMNSNTSFSPSGNQIYFLNNVLKVSESGTERDVVTPADTVTWTGATHSFVGVTNFLLPTTAPDYAGEIAVNTTNHQLLFHTGGASADNALQSFDFDSCSSGYILKTDGNGVWTCQADATSGSPTLNSIGSPTGDTTIAMDAGEEVNFNFTGDYTTGSQFKIEQLTGNPSGGVLFEVKAADSDTTAARIGDGTNYVQVSQAGDVSFAGTATIALPTGSVDALEAAAVMKTEGATVVLGNGTDVVATGTHWYTALRVPMKSTLTKVGVTTNQGTGTCTIDVWKGSLGATNGLANITVGNSIFGVATKPALTSGDKNVEVTSFDSGEDATAAGDWVVVNVDAVATLTMIHVYFEFTRTD